MDPAVRRGEPTQKAWEQIAPLLPRADGRGRPWRNHRQVINGVLWRLRSGTPWRDVPDRYGPWQTIYERFARWETDGTWAKLLEHVQVHQDAAGTVKWTISVDSTIARAHQHASGARAARTPAGDEREDPTRPVGNDQALGRSRGGLTTKVHLACDGRGLPLTLVVTPGNVNDSTVFDTLMDTLRVPRAGDGRPRCRPDAVIADKAYSSRAIRQALRGRGIRAVIPERTDQKANRVRRGQAGGRPPTFDRELYKDRNVVERCFARLKQFRAIATRFDKPANRHKAGLQLASLILWLREPAQDPLSDRPWDGQYAARTAAVKKFQAAYGLSADGVAGPAAFSKIYALQDADCTPVHFGYAELNKCNSDWSGGAVSAATAKSNALRTMWKPEAMRHALGDVPISVSSGFRSRACNNAVGGSATSRHLYGDAADLVGSPSLCRLAQQPRTHGFSEILGPGYPGHNNHTHVAFDPSPYWSAPTCGI